MFLLSPLWDHQVHFGSTHFFSSSTLKARACGELFWSGCLLHPVWRGLMPRRGWHNEQWAQDWLFSWVFALLQCVGLDQSAACQSKKDPEAVPKIGVCQRGRQVVRGGSREPIGQRPKPGHLHSLSYIGV